MITNCHKNIMGTASFDGKFQGMRKPQEFIVYPMQDSGPNIHIQSDSRFGCINLDTGALVLSPATKSHAGDLHLQVSIARGLATCETISAEELQTLRQWIKSTGGLAVGRSIVLSDNTGAMAL